MIQVDNYLSIFKIRGHTYVMRWEWESRGKAYSQILQWYQNPHLNVKIDDAVLMNKSIRRPGDMLHNPKPPRAAK